MKHKARISMICLLVSIVCAGSVGAVGYDRRIAPDTGPPPETKASCPPAKPEASKPEAPKPKTWLDRGPGLLDDATAVVKDILGQFGIVERKAP